LQLDGLDLHLSFHGYKLVKHYDPSQVAMILYLSTIAVSLMIVAEGDVDDRVLILCLFFKIQWSI